MKKTAETKTLKNEIKKIINITGAITLIINFILLIAPVVFIIDPNNALSELYTPTIAGSYARFIIVMATSIYFSMIAIPAKLRAK